MKKFLFKISVLTVFVLLVSSSLVSAQCPMCRTAVESAMEGGSSIGNGLNFGILYLLAMPYLFFTIIAFFWYRNFKKKKQMESIFE
ncbi:MAG: hypothetical protein EA412_08145 [Chitinophagaceae bacterium]|jgi:hypothetical protein|nr:MAG: hypothetical protein EA412_08145 [Chitinophagaceae bacterium]